MSDKRIISVVGLGYVGLPVAVAFSQANKVIGFDKNSKRIAELQQGYDRTLEISNKELSSCSVHFTADPRDLKQANFHIVAVPTPIDEVKNPDLKILMSAAQVVGENLQVGSIVVFESTVFPGVTEDICVPILENASGLTFGKDFTVGYSPERINPGDKEHTFTKIKKIVSGSDPKTLDIVADVYSSVVTAGVHRAPSIKVAEAAKAIENTQRDLNIALMNELSIIFNHMDIDTQEVLAAANTKWNFLPFRPGLVGGHCIGVDPYYLTHKAESLGYHPEVILAGRRINDNMGKHIVSQTIKRMIQQGIRIREAKIAILGLTFKENCPDIRNTRVIDIYREFVSFGTTPLVHDPLADKEQAAEEYGIKLVDWESIDNVTTLVLAVAHDFYKQQGWNHFTKILTPIAHITDVKGMLDPNAIPNNQISYWRI